jgi:hypothetical protein
VGIAVFLVAAILVDSKPPIRTSDNPSTQTSALVTVQP